MVGTYRFFYEVTGDEKWKNIFDQTIDLIFIYSKRLRPQTGLLPEFIWKKEGEWTPVDPHFLEG